MVVLGAEDAEVVRQVARILLYHLVQSVVVAVVFVVFETAPVVLPVGNCLAAIRHWALLALPGFVQSYWRVVVVLVIFVVVVLVGLAAAAAAPFLQAVLLAFPGFEQS